jgi:glycosyltransferase involved in cell wall biosynthesis
MTSPVFSIVIPVYNRAWSVRRAVESAIAFSDEEVGTEILLVDDGSSDNSVEVIEELIREKRNSTNVRISFFRHATNKGVCAAKNSGAKAASGAWLVFLDSDDELIENTATAVNKALTANEKHPLHFFKCINENVLPVFEVNNNFELRDFRTYVRKGTNGEALPVVRREVFMRYLYDEDIRGYESLSYLRIVREFSVVVINSLAARRYYTSHEDRLSSKEGMRMRYKDLARGHLRALSEHHSDMGFTNFVAFMLRYFKAKIITLFG